MARKANGGIKEAAEGAEKKKGELLAELRVLGELGEGGTVEVLGDEGELAGGEGGQVGDEEEQTSDERGGAAARTLEEKVRKGGRIPAVEDGIEGRKKL